VPDLLWYPNLYTSGNWVLNIVLEYLGATLPTPKALGHLRCTGEKQPAWMRLQRWPLEMPRKPRPEEVPAFRCASKWKCNRNLLL
jgi:hypothetical protein